MNSRTKSPVTISNGQHIVCVIQLKEKIAGTLLAQLFIFCTRTHANARLWRPNILYSTVLCLYFQNGLFYDDGFPFFCSERRVLAFLLNHCFHFHFHFNYPASFRAHHFNGMLLKKYIIHYISTRSTLLFILLTLMLRLSLLLLSCCCCCWWYYYCCHLLGVIHFSIEYISDVGFYFLCFILFCTILSSSSSSFPSNMYKCMKRVFFLWFSTLARLNSICLDGANSSACSTI